MPEANSMHVRFACNEIRHQCARDKYSYSVRIAIGPSSSLYWIHNHNYGVFRLKSNHHPKNKPYIIIFPHPYIRLPLPWSYISSRSSRSAFDLQPHHHSLVDDVRPSCDRVAQNAYWLNGLGSALAHSIHHHLYTYSDHSMWLWSFGDCWCTRS